MRGDKLAATRPQRRRDRFEIGGRIEQWLFANNSFNASGAALLDEPAVQPDIGADAYDIGANNSQHFANIPEALVNFKTSSEFSEVPVVDIDTGNKFTARVSPEHVRVRVANGVTAAFGATTPGFTDPDDDSLVHENPE
jgi:hypothetical protein